MPTRIFQTQGFARAMEIIFVMLLVALSVSALFQWSQPARHLSFAFLVFTLFGRNWDLFPAAFLIFFLYSAGAVLPEEVWRIPAAGFLVPLAALAVVTLPFGPTRAAWGWLRRGELDQVSGLLAVVTSLVAGVALILWALWTDFLGVGERMVAEFRDIPRWVLFLVGVPAFSVINATAEESVYRGVLQETVARRFSRPLWSLLLPASAFAAAHAQVGFPNGKLGYAMTFVYGATLGYLRLRTGGMLAPLLVHVCADLVIGTTLLLLVL
jgi:membrane protease YdiL (CAAX protease family)